MINVEWRKDGERLDDLQNHGLYILQKTDGYRFGMDSVLLSHFARLKPGDRVADLGTGSGVLPLLLSQREPTARFFAFEKDAETADRARRSVAMNGLENRITVYAEDWQSAPALLGAQSLDAVVSNPPYQKPGGGTQNPGISRLLACRETEGGLLSLSRAASAILKNRGRFWLCFPAARMLELADTLRSSRLEPKRMCMVISKLGLPPYLALVEAVKNAAPGLTWLPPLIVKDQNGKETAELRALYENGDTDGSTAE